MKFTALLACFLAIATAMVGHTDFDMTKCRDYLSEVDKGLSAVEMIEKDLLNGKWTATTNDHRQLTYLFAENGALHQFTENAKGHTDYTSFFWHIILTEGNPVLQLTTIDHHEKWMDIEQTCDGITLTDIHDGQPLHFDYQPVSVPKKLDSASNNLMGEWTNVTMLQAANEPIKTAGAFLNFSFDMDGSFYHEYGNRTKRVLEKGNWEVSRDGQFLLLHIHENNEPTLSGGVKVVKINQLDDHGLVLEEVMKDNEVGRFFDVENKVFTFIR